MMEPNTELPVVIGGIKGLISISVPQLMIFKLFSVYFFMVLLLLMVIIKCLKVLPLFMEIVPPDAMSHQEIPDYTGTETFVNEPNK